MASVEGFVCFVRSSASGRRDCCMQFGGPLGRKVGFRRCATVARTLGGAALHLLEAFPRLESPAPRPTGLGIMECWSRLATH